MSDTPNNTPFEISVTGIWCGSGIIRAKKAILAVPGVTSVKVDLARSVARIEGDFDVAAVAAIVDQIVQDGAVRAAELAEINRGCKKT